jgi:hypothetical protein
MISRLGYHILGYDRALQYDDNRVVRVGTRLEYADTDTDRMSPGNAKRPPKLCERGMHASRTPEFCEEIVGATDIDWLCRVLVEGTNHTSRTSNNKFVGTHRTVLGMIKWGEYQDICSTYSNLSGKQIEKKVLEAMTKRNKRNKVKNPVVK